MQATLCEVHGNLLSFTADFRSEHKAVHAVAVGHRQVRAALGTALCWVMVRYRRQQQPQEPNVLHGLCVRFLFFLLSSPLPGSVTVPHLSALLKDGARLQADLSPESQRHRWQLPRRMLNG